MRYEAILFDFDGVLADSEPIHFACWREILADFGLQLDWETYCTHGIGVSDRDLFAKLCEQSDPPLSVDRLIAEYPRKKDLFRARMLESLPFPAEVLELLPQLHGYQLAVVTSSGKAEIEPVLIRAGLCDFFHAAVYAGDVKRLKPAPDPYLLAAERLGIRRGLVVEDSDAGEASARAAGLDVLRVSGPREMPALLRARLNGA